MERYFICKNGKYIDEVFVTVDETVMDVFINWLHKNGYEGMYTILDQLEEKELSIKINDNLCFSIRYRD